MKDFRSLRMGFVLSGLILTACENDGKDLYQAPSNIEIIKEHSNAYVQLFSFHVKPRDWQLSSSTDRQVDISLPCITDSVLRGGAVIIYLNEAGKNVSLPFTYYQIRRIISFQPSYEKGHAYVNILGNFILSMNTSYAFKILVVNAKALKQFKDLNWHNFNAVDSVLNKDI